MKQNMKTTGSSLLDLRAVVVPDEDAFFAQGLDVDYFASGETAEEAERNFEEGLEKLVQLHLHKFGNVARLREKTAEKTTGQFSTMQFSSLESHELHGNSKKHLYPKVVYYLP